MVFSDKAPKPGAQLPQDNLIIPSAQSSSTFIPIVPAHSSSSTSRVFQPLVQGSRPPGDDSSFQTFNKPLLPEPNVVPGNHLGSLSSSSSSRPKSATLTRSGRMSADPFPLEHRQFSHPRGHQSVALNALDLDPLDLRNIDPALAKQILDEIKSGADIEPVLTKFQVIQASSKRRESAIGISRKTPELLNPVTHFGSRREKTVTFLDEPAGPNCSNTITMQNLGTTAGASTINSPTFTHTSATNAQTTLVNTLGATALLKSDNVLM